MKSEFILFLIINNLNVVAASNFLARQISEFMGNLNWTVKLTHFIKKKIKAQATLEISWLSNQASNLVCLWHFICGIEEDGVEKLKQNKKPYL